MSEHRVEEPVDAGVQGSFMARNIRRFAVPIMIICAAVAREDPERCRLH